jgi:pseudo-rSAM protein
MFDRNKNYWLYIESHVYCSIKDDRALLYNTQNGENMETGLQEGLELLRSLHEKKNLGAIYCEGKMLMQTNYREFVYEFCKKGMGNVVDIAQVREKPVQLMPVLSLQRDVTRLQKENDRYTGEEILRYLIELNIYLHDICRQDCLLCSDYFRQKLCCTAKKCTHPETMNISTLRSILSQIRHGTVGKINLLGGSLPEYLHYKELPSLLADFKEQVHIWNHYANFVHSQTILSDFLYDIPVTFPVKENEWQNCVALLKDTKAKYHFFITGIGDYEKTEALIEKYSLQDYIIHPVYTNENHAFFKENVYIHQEEIFHTKHSFRRIFASQKLNTHFFGSLTILPNGEVLANVNNFVLGNVATDTLLDIIHKEMIDNTAWRKIRDATPCVNCLYQYLCPSPSNYETIIGKPNLCHIIKE